VIGMENEQDIQCADEDRMRLVCDPTGRRCSREGITMREMIELKEESQQLSAYRVTPRVEDTYDSV